MESKVKFQFLPVKFAWAAIHPDPSGIIYFIGGAFFGSFPSLFYRFFLESLFHQRFTIVALPFRFSFRHWSIALSFVENQNDVLKAIEEEAVKQGFDYTLYTRARETGPTARKLFQEYWIGHSLGCKYIGLLELLTDLEMFDRKNVLSQCAGSPQAQYIDSLINKSHLETVSLYNQPSVLLDPIIADIDNAVPIKVLQKLFTRIISVLPSRDETLCLVQHSKLFSLTAVISFKSALAQDSVSQLKFILKNRLNHFKELTVNDSWTGKHLSILGINSGDQTIVDAVIEQLRKYTSRQAV